MVNVPKTNRFPLLGLRARPRAKTKSGFIDRKRVGKTATATGWRRPGTGLSARQGRETVLKGLWSATVSQERSAPFNWDSEMQAERSHSGNGKKTSRVTAKPSPTGGMSSQAEKKSSKPVPEPVRSKYSADPQVSIVQQVVTVTANKSQPWLSPNVFPLCV